MVVVLEEIMQSVEILLKLIKRSQPSVGPNLDPVLLVPGIAGSILKAVGENGQGERDWVRIIGADYKFRTKLWSSTGILSGQTVSLGPKTRIDVPEERFGLHAIDVLDPEMVVGFDIVDDERNQKGVQLNTCRHLLNADIVEVDDKLRVSF